jgi:hypothetical protein
MADGEKRKNLESNSSGQHITDMSNAGTFFQPFWVRRRSIFSNIMDREFMESQSRLVLYCGTIFWVIFLLSQAF